MHEVIDAIHHLGTAKRFFFEARRDPRCVRARGCNTNTTSTTEWAYETESVDSTTKATTTTATVEVAG